MVCSLFVLLSPGSSTEDVMVYHHPLTGGGVEPAREWGRARLPLSLHKKIAFFPIPSKLPYNALSEPLAFLGPGIAKTLLSILLPLFLVKTLDNKKGLPKVGPLSKTEIEKYQTM